MVCVLALLIAILLFPVIASTSLLMMTTSNGGVGIVEWKIP